MFTPPTPSSGNNTESSSDSISTTISTNNRSSPIPLNRSPSSSYQEILLLPTRVCHVSIHSFKRSLLKQVIITTTFTTYAKRQFKSFGKFSFYTSSWSFSFWKFTHSFLIRFFFITKF